MSAEVLKYSREQIETMEVAPGFKHENLEGWIPEFASDHDAHEALEKAFDYRGDVTLTLKSGERIEPTSSTVRPAQRWRNRGCSTSRPRRREAQGELRGDCAA